eukprot:403337879
METQQLGGPRKLFKYHLESQIRDRDNRPLFFRRNLRWRLNSREYAQPFSKKGVLRGYIKYGIFAYASWHYLASWAFFPAQHGHGHGHEEQGHGHHGASSHGNDHSHQDKKHH